DHLAQPSYRVAVVDAADQPQRIGENDRVLTGDHLLASEPGAFAALPRYRMVRPVYGLRGGWNGVASLRWSKPRTGATGLLRHGVSRRRGRFPCAPAPPPRP